MARLYRFFPLILLLSLLSACAPAQQATPPAIGGFLDLSNWDFAKNGPAILTGDWELYWNQLLTPQDFASVTPPQPTGYFLVPQAWQGVKVGDVTLPAMGYTTMRLRIRLPYSAEPYAVYLKVEKMAWRAWLNGREVADKGVVGTTPATTAAANNIDKINFHIEPGQDVDLVIQVANFHYAIGGARNTMLIAPASLLDRRIIQQVSFDIFLFGAFIAIAIYHISLFALRPSDPRPLYVAAFTILIGFWRLMQGEAIFAALFPQIPGSILIRIELLCAFTLPMAISAFIRSLYPDEWSRPATWLVGGVFGALALSVILLPTNLSSQGLTVFRVALPLYALLAVWVIIRAVAHRRNGALMIFVAALLLAIASVLDTLVVMLNRGWQVTAVLFPLGILGMALVQAFLLSRRTSQAYQTIETQATRLAELGHAYYRFVPQAFLNLLSKKDITEISLGDQLERDMAVLFVDIRGFTSISEHMTPAEVFSFLNSILGGLAPIVRQNGGFVDKYLGDGFMALFPGSIQDAMKAGVDIRRYMETFNHPRLAQGQRPIVITMALHTGHIMLGTVGEPERMDGTVVADAVNTTSRLEDLAKRSNVTFLISEQVYKTLPDEDKADVRYLGEVILRGRETPLKIFDVFSGDPLEVATLKRKTRADFETGLHLFQARAFERARDLFDLVTMTNPEDTLAAYYWSISEHFAATGLPSNWDGIQIAPE